jgi:hypothetical protein
MVVLSGSGFLLLLLGLLLSGVRALIGKMPGLSTIVAYAGWKFFNLGHLLWNLLVMEIPLRLVLEWGHSPLPRWRGLRRPMSMLLVKAELLARFTAGSEISLSLPILLCLLHGILLRDSFVY